MDLGRHEFDPEAAVCMVTDLSVWVWVIGFGKRGVAVEAELSAATASSEAESACMRGSRHEFPMENKPVAKFQPVGAKFTNLPLAHDGPAVCGSNRFWHVRDGWRCGAPCRPKFHRHRASCRPGNRSRRAHNFSTL